MKPGKILIFFLATSILYLGLILVDASSVAWYLKPLLLPALFLAVFFSETFRNRALLLAALVFSWIGDVVLMFADRGQWFFIGGLLAFLIAHVVYMVLFTREKRPYPTLYRNAIRWGFTAILLYLVGMLNMLMPYLGPLQVPVVVYAFTISVMLATAFIGFSAWPTPAKYQILIGAILFVLSDSILAFDKFYEPVWMASFFIMFTYLGAQYFIVRGVLALHLKRNIP